MTDGGHIEFRKNANISVLDKNILYFAHNFVQRCNTGQTEDGNYKTAFSLYNVVKSAATTATSSSGFDEMKM